MHHEVAMTGGDGRVAGCCQSSVGGVMNYLDAVATFRIIGNDLLQDVNTGIRGSIVYENELELLISLLEGTTGTTFDIRLYIVDWHQDADEGRWHREEGRWKMEELTPIYEFDDMIQILFAQQMMHGKADDLVGNLRSNREGLGCCAG